MTSPSSKALVPDAGAAQEAAASEPDAGDEDALVVDVTFLVTTGITFLVAT
jgi:hypothetical protein